MKTRFVRSNLALFALALLLGLSVTSTSRAADRTWTNTAGGIYQTAVNWSPNLVPTAADTAVFTNNASYQVTWTSNSTVAVALLNAPGGVVTQAVSGFNWTVTNRYVVGENVGDAAAFRHASGRLAVTNSAGNALLELRRGTNTFNAGVIEADRLLLTNSTGRLTFNGGTLITRGASISNGTFFVVGSSNGFGPATWIVLSNASPTALSSSLIIGNFANNASLLITNGGTVINNSFGSIGESSSSTNNTVLVSGSGSTWVSSSELDIGYSGSFNTLRITNGGTVRSSDVFVGFNSASSNNLLTVAGGTLISTNASAIGVLNVRRGAAAFSGGNITADRLFLTNGAASQFAFSAGTLTVRQSSVSNGVPFQVGDGVGAATYLLNGAVTNVHAFADGLVLTNNATLAGNGTVTGAVTVAVGGLLTPGTSVGKISFTTPPTLAGTTVMEISRNGGTLTNDILVVTGTLTNGGSLIVTNIGTNALALGNTFTLLQGPSRNGAFTNLILPALPVGLGWSNRLVADGAIEVAVAPVADAVWTNTAGGNFETAANWLDNFVPRPQDSATFISNASYTVTFAGSVTNADVFFRAASGTVTKSTSFGTWTVTNSYTLGPEVGQNPTVIQPSGTLRVANVAGTATLEIRRGTMMASNLSTVEADRLRLTNSAGQFLLVGGTLHVRNSFVNNTQPFHVEGGGSFGGLKLLGFGTHTFANGLLLTNLGSVSGQGTIDGPVTVRSGGTISPASSPTFLILGGDPGMLNTGNLLVDTGATYGVNLTGPAPGTGGYDQLSVNGTVTLNGASLSVDLSSGFTSTNGGQFTIIANDGADGVVGTFNGLPNGAVTNVSGHEFAINYFGGTGNDVVLTYIRVPPSITNQPVSLTVAQGSNATFNVAVEGTAPLAYQWRFNGTNLAGANSASFTRINAQLVHAGDYTVVITNLAGSVTSSIATLTVAAPPSVSSPPASLVVAYGSNATFSVTAGGFAPLAYQWRFDGNNIPGATASNYVVTSAQATDAGTYSVLVTNIAGTVITDGAVLVVTNSEYSYTAMLNGAQEFPPVGTPASGSANLTLNPSSSNLVYQVAFTNVSGLNAAHIHGPAPFGVNAGVLFPLNAPPGNPLSGAFYGATPPLSFQSGYLTADLLYINLHSVGFPGGEIRGQILKSVSPPAITTQPASLAVLSNSDAAFAVSASGTGPLAYQWRINGTNLAGANADAYTRTNAQLSDAGNYTVVITNVAGSVTSAVAVLTVVTPGDRTWTNSAGGTYQTGVNWSPNVVPTAADNAVFTNAASYQVTWTNAAAAANAFFAAPSGVVTQAIGGFTWLLTDSYLLGPDAGQLPTIRHTSGTLRVTNAAGTGVLEVRGGTNIFNAGVIEADRLVLTNSAGHFIFNSGTLITRGASISNGANFNVGAGSGSKQATWIVLSNSTPTLVDSFFVGVNATNCMVLITNGGELSGGSCIIGNGGAASNNTVMVSGSGSTMDLVFSLSLGISGSGGNSLHITGGGTVSNHTGTIGTGRGNNTVLVSGHGSTWVNRGGLTVGKAGPFNTLLITNGGTVSANLITANGVTVMVGDSTNSLGNRLTVAGGTLLSTNLVHTATLDIRRGTNLFEAGLIKVSRLWLTNTLGFFEFNGGTLDTRFAAVSNGVPFVVGNGSIPATYFLNGAATNLHAFADSLVLTNNAILTGNGTVNGLLTVAAGATVAPGTSMGRLNLTQPPALGGTLVMELSKSGVTLTNDLVSVTGTLTYGGDLVVTNIGPDALALGNSFKLFGATSYAGSFASLTLPPLTGGLVWTNKLLLDGSVQVVVIPPGDRYWTNTAGGSYQVAGNWSPNVVPGGADNARFTNAANYQVTWAASANAANAFFSAPSGVVTQAVGGFTWRLTNSYLIGPDAGLLPTVTHASGTLRVTNAPGSAVLEVRGGTNILAGGLVVTDRLLLTNTAGRLVFNGGTFVTRGATVANGAAFVVGDTGGTPATWDVRAGAPNTVSSLLIVGNTASHARLLLTNGAALTSDGASLGSISGANSNAVVIAGPGSIWTNTALTQIGREGNANSLVVSNGGAVFNTETRLGDLVFFFASQSNVVQVTGPGSRLHNSGRLSVGEFGAANRLEITGGGEVTATNCVVGVNTAATGNRLLVDGGSLFVTNAAQTAQLEIRRGTNVLTAGLIEADDLRLPNSLGRFQFDSGLLSLRASLVNNTQPFIVGNGLDAATLHLMGDGTHTFNNGLTLSTNALLTGNATLNGAVTLAAGSTLAPGASPGRVHFNTPPALGGVTVMDVSRDGVTLTNDIVSVTGTLIYGGSLIVTNIGPDALVAGNTFQLFPAGSYGGGFSAITLPPLGGGLIWITNLLANGSIQVTNVSAATPPVISGVTRSGTNVIFTVTNGTPGGTWNQLTATNVALPLVNWTTNSSGVFDPSGNVTLTNGLNVTEPKRFFRIGLP